MDKEIVWRKKADPFFVDPATVGAPFKYTISELTPNQGAGKDMGLSHHVLIMGEGGAWARVLPWDWQLKSLAKKAGLKKITDLVGKTFLSSQPACNLAIESLLSRCKRRFLWW